MPVDKITMKVAKYGFLMACLSWPSVPYALESMTDQEMGKVNGRDGVTLNLQVDQSDAITAEQIRWDIDTGQVDGANQSLANQVIIGGADNDGSLFSIKPIAIDGGEATQPLNMALAVDAYTNDFDRPGLGLDATWSRMRIQMDSLTVTNVGRSFGSVALDSAGRFAIFGDGGLFNSNSVNNKARLVLNLGNVDVTGGTGSRVSPSNWIINDPGNLYFRMKDGGTEAILHNFGFLFDMHEGIVGIDPNGLVLSSAAGSRTDLNLTFDIYANATGHDFQFEPFAGASTSIPMLFFGWRGGLEDFDLALQSKGSWLDSGVHTQGLTASLGFDLADDFQFVIGEAGGDRAYLEFADPVRLAHADGTRLSNKDVEFGYLTLDTVGAGQDTVPNICYGGANAYGGAAAACSTTTGNALPLQEIDLPASDTGLALIGRDWGLHAYSSHVRYRDPVHGDVDDGWALIYTLGNVSSNWYLYPQAGDGSDAETSPGFTMDVAAAIQTVGGADALGRPDRSRWEYGTNLMIGDTDFQTSYHDVSNPKADGLAIGLMGADLLFVADDMGVSLTQLEGLGVSSNAVRLQLRGMFGGGDIPRMTSPVYGSYIDTNLEFDKFQFHLFPALFDGDFINFGGFFSLTNSDRAFAGSAAQDDTDDGSYISFAEPNFNKLNVDVRLADITGDIEVPLSVVGDGGKIDLLYEGGKPKLKVETNMKVGRAAAKPGGGVGDPLSVGRIEFGNKDLGSMIIPSARIYTSITLEQQ